MTTKLKTSRSLLSEILSFRRPLSKEGGGLINKDVEKAGYHCDPECLLEAPEARKLRKVVRIGCKKVFGLRVDQEAYSTTTRRVARWKTRMHWCKRLLGDPFPSWSKQSCTLP